jgi:hypothetical protein
MEHPKDVGDRTTLTVMLALHESGYQVATPFGENTRYDLILDDGATLLRIQCKTGRLRKGAIEFPTASSYYHHPNEKPTQRHYQGQVDHFAVYCRQTGGVYLIPIGELPLDRAYLRVAAPLNGQRKRIRYAKDYEIARIDCLTAGGSRSQCEDPDDGLERVTGFSQ